MSFLSKMLSSRKSIVGLDIGVSSIKVVELKGETLEDVRLETYAIVPIPKELITGGDQYSAEIIPELSKLVRDCMKRAGCSSKYVVTCLRAGDSVNKTIVMPKYDSQEDFNFAVENEVVNIIPGDMNASDLSLDYMVAGETVEGENQVLVVASKRDKVEQIQAIVEGAGLTLEILDVDIFSYANTLRLMKQADFETQNYVIADCSSNVLRLFAYSKGEFKAYKESQVGGMSLTSEIMSATGKSYAEVEEIKRGDVHAEDLQPIFDNFFQTYRSEIVSGLQYFLSTTNISEFDEVLLTGGVSSMKGFEKEVRDALAAHPDIVVKVNPYIARPLINAEKSPRVNARFEMDEPGLFLATTLAVRQYLRPY